MEDDPTHGSGRERWWRAAHELTTWEPDDPATGAVAEQLLDRCEQYRACVVADWRSGRDGWPAAWRRAAEQSDFLLRLTPHELREVGDALRGALSPGSSSRGPAATERRRCRSKQPSPASS